MKKCVRGLACPLPCSPFDLLSVEIRPQRRSSPYPVPSEPVIHTLSPYTIPVNLHHNPLTTYPVPVNPHHNPLTLYPNPANPHHNPLTTYSTPTNSHPNPLIALSPHNHDTCQQHMHTNPANSHQYYNTALTLAHAQPIPSDYRL